MLYQLFLSPFFNPLIWLLIPSELDQLSCLPLMNTKHKARLRIRLATDDTRQMMIILSMLRLAKVYKRSEVVTGTIQTGVVVLVAVKLVVVELLAVQLLLVRGYSSEYANHVISEKQIDHLYQVRHFSTKLVVVTLQTQVTIIAAQAPKSKLLVLIRTVGTFSKGVGKVTTVEILLSPQP